MYIVHVEGTQAFIVKLLNAFSIIVASNWFVESWISLYMQQSNHLNWTWTYEGKQLCMIIVFAI